MTIAARALPGRTVLAYQEIFDNNITLGAEYLYNEFDNIGGNKLSGNTIEARIGYRF